MGVEVIECDSRVVCSNRRGRILLRQLRHARSRASHDPRDGRIGEPEHQKRTDGQRPVQWIESTASNPRRLARSRPQWHEYLLLDSLQEHLPYPFTRPCFTRQGCRTRNRLLHDLAISWPRAMRAVKPIVTPSRIPNLRRSENRRPCVRRRWAIQTARRLASITSELFIPIGSPLPTVPAFSEPLIISGWCGKARSRGFRHRP